MSKRPVFWRELGDFFESLRLDRQWGQRQAAEIARRRGLKPLTRQVLLRLETGQTKNPEPDVLRALAELYDMPYDELAGRFIKHRYDLPPGSSQNAGDPPDVPLAARRRILELEYLVASYTAQLAEVEEVAVRVVELVAPRKFDPDGIRQSSVPTRDATKTVIAESTVKRAISSGESLAVLSQEIPSTSSMSDHGQTTSVPGAPRALDREIRVAANSIRGIAKEAEQAGTVVKPPRPKRGTRKYAAATRAHRAGGSARDRKHRR